MLGVKLSTIPEVSTRTMACFPYFLPEDPLLVYTLVQGFANSPGN